MFFGKKEGLRPLFLCLNVKISCISSILLLRLLQVQKSNVSLYQITTSKNKNYEINSI